MNLTRAQLLATAEELNKKLGIDPPIDTKGSRSELKANVRDASALVAPSDKLSKETKAIVDHFRQEAAEKPETDEGEETNTASDDADTSSADPEPAEDGEPEGDAADPEPKPAKAAKSGDQGKGKGKGGGKGKQASKASKDGEKKQGAIVAKGEARKGSFAEFIDNVLINAKTLDDIKGPLEAESARRGVKMPTVGNLRAHLKYRQERGKLTDVTIPTK